MHHTETPKQTPEVPDIFDPELMYERLTFKLIEASVPWKDAKAVDERAHGHNGEAIYKRQEAMKRINGLLDQMYDLGICQEIPYESL